MSAFAVVAQTVLPGVELRLIPTRLTLSADLDSPARAMEGVFPLADFPPELTSLRVLRGEEELFAGQVDRQKAGLSPGGITLTLEARDKGAALLDNEARPAAYQNLNAAYLFQELMAPHGFLLVSASSALVPRFTVRKGQSLWDAFSTFTRLASGLVPYVSGDMVVVDLPRGPQTWELGGAERPLISLEYTVDHYQVLSRVCIRDELGNYPTQVENPAAAPRGISRTRYAIPAGEHMALPVWDADQLIRRGMRAMAEVTATLPGTLVLRPGEGVWIRHPQANLPNLLVRQVHHRLEERGETTRLVLGSALYY